PFRRSRFASHIFRATRPSPALLAKRARPARPRRLAFRASEYFSPDSKPTDRKPAIAAAVPPCARDAPTAPIRQPAQPKTKSSAKPAAYTDSRGALRGVPEVRRPLE